MALILRNDGSQSPDRWLREPRNNHPSRFAISSGENPNSISILAWECRIKSKRLDFIRHSHASMLVDMGFPALEIAERLGHESVKTTLDTYSHLYPKKDSTIAGRLNEFRKK